MTTINNIDFYYSKDFQTILNENQSIDSEIQKKIEKDYLNYLLDSCQESLRLKHEIELRIASASYYQKNEYYLQQLEQMLQNLDHSNCDLHSEFQDKIK